jgi:ribosomal protein S12 methylthiotransferase
LTERTFRLTSLGCAKNLVDSEGLAGQLVRAGWRMVAAGPADLVIVNTCGFIEEAAQESVNALLAEIEEKRAGRSRWLAAVGCLPQKYQGELARALPAIDLVAGVSDMFHLAELADGLARRRRRVTAVTAPGRRYEESEARLVSTPRHRAYLKVAEGCSNACAYCIIGRLRGPFRSRAPQAVVREARDLVAQGAVELSLVAQDLTQYGRDLEPKTSLAALLRRLDRVRGLRWIRLLYAHPARVDDRLARTIAACRQVVPYLDVPLQHVSDRVLVRMGRPQTRAQSEAVIARLRREVPRLALRTTFLVGHPGETDADFAELLAFVRRHRFEHLGAFAWSPEEGTPSYAQTPWVPEDVRQGRLARLLAVQQQISRQVWRGWIGREVEVLIEEGLHQHSARAFTHVGRLAQQAPEVDGVTYVRAPRETSCQVGEIVRARVIRAAEYDLFAVLL